MIAVAHDEPGDPSVLTLREVPVPQPGPGEVRVRLVVSGVNPSDWKSRATGLFWTDDGRPQVPHQDGAGVIDAVGPGVHDGRVGERVWLHSSAWRHPWGTAAQWTVQPEQRAVALHEAASFDLGASLGVPALTAYRCLREAGPIDGRTVLVTGGAGAVGHCAIELAKHLGARVITTVSTDDKASLAVAAGADVVVNYREQDVAAEVRRHAPEGVERIVEVSPSANLATNLAVLADGGCISTYSTEGGNDIPTTVRALIDLNAHLQFVMVYLTPAPLLARAVDGVNDALAAGALSPLPLLRFALQDTADAHRAGESGVIGKVLVDIP